MRIVAGWRDDGEQILEVVAPKTDQVLGKLIELDDIDTASDCDRRVSNRRRVGNSVWLHGDTLPRHQMSLSETENDVAVNRQLGVRAQYARDGALERKLGNESVEKTQRFRDQPRGVIGKRQLPASQVLR